MNQTLMSITDYCKYRDLSRKQFYHHKQTGALKGCFAQKPGYKKDFVVKELADEALKKNVRYNRGGRATKRKYKKIAEQMETEMPELYDAATAGFFMHEFLCSEFGLTFKDTEPVTLEDMEERTSEGLDMTFRYIIDIATGDAEDPAESAIMAVFMALLGTTVLNIDYEKLAKRPRLFAEIDKIKQKQKTKKGN